MSDPLKTYNHKANKHIPYPGTEDWVEVATLRHSESYDWADFNAFYSPSARRYFWHGDSGCSCSDWDGGITSAADFENGDRESLLRAWKAFADNRDHYVSAAAYTDGVTTIRNFKETAK